MKIKNILNQLSLQETQETYEEPIIKIFEVKVELGYNLSNDPRSTESEDPATF
jgi:hypothetical protein